ncbi:MAG: hypothetical protein LQ351_007160 [Letrouitia transgressa]|nr:MAG: hypothetical protein LQ351_007160 [Letrouitia transgressa]
MANNVQNQSIFSRRDSAHPHIPRLAYRNACPIASISRNSVITIETESSAVTTSTAATSPQSSRFPANASSLDNGNDKCISSSASSLAPKSPGPTKKKGSFLKFFTVKEPSTQAFEVYQEQMRKRGTTQNGRVTAVGLPGVSSAKLPPTVPKVNSKWDGVPQAAKDKGNHRNSFARQSISSSANRPIHTSKSTTSNKTASSTTSDIRINGKLRYNNSSGNLSDLYGWEAAAPSSRSSAKSFILEPPKTASSSTAITPLSDISSFFPPQPPSIPEAFLKTSTSSAGTPPPLEHGNNDPSPAQTLSEPSPITPNTPDVAWPLPMPLSHPNSAQDTIKTTTIDVPSQPAHDQVLLSSSGIRILGPPASAKRRPKIDPSISEAQNMTLPPSPGIVNGDFDFEPSPVVTSTADHSQSAEWPLPSVPPPPPPEAGLMKRQNSARDRLKLGMTLRNNSTPGIGGGLDLDALDKSTSPTTPGGFKARAKNKLLSFNRGL